MSTAIIFRVSTPWKNMEKYGKFGILRNFFYEK